jgi:hypothetical protein
VVTSLNQKLEYLPLEISNGLHGLYKTIVLLGVETANPVDVPSSSSETTSQVIHDNSAKVP